LKGQGAGFWPFLFSFTAEMLCYIGGQSTNGNKSSLFDFNGQGHGKAHKSDIKGFADAESLPQQYEL
jgi:hypothetical protein